jgi:Spy/CpxP family protein refolding chaperone
MEKQAPVAQAAASMPRRWLIAGLAAVSIAAVGATFAWHERAEAQGHMMGHHGFGFDGGPVDPAALGKRIDAMVQWMLADIDATDDQRTKIATILKGAANDLAPLRTQHVQARKNTMQVLAAPTIDRAQLEAIRVQQMQLADTATRRMTQAIADAADVLNADQRAKLITKWQQRRGHGRGQQQN